MNGTTLATGQAPSMRLPGPFFLAGLSAFGLAGILLAAAGGRLNPADFFTLGLTHLVTLAWATMIVMGALYQMIPVILAVPIHSEILGRVQFYLYLLGVTLLIGSFWSSSLTGLIVGGTLTVLAGLLFAYNLLRTFRAVRDWNPAGVYIATGTGYLVLTLLWGLTQALNFRYQFLPLTISPLGLHLVLGMIGWFLLTLLGVSYKLVPMFNLAHGFAERLLWPIYILLNLSIVGLVVDSLVRLPEVLTGLLWGLGLLALLLFAVHVRGILRHRHRRNLDISQVHAFTGFSYLGLGVLLAGYPLIHGDTAQAYLTLAYLFFFGFLSVSIMGYLYKIVPFVVWFNKYSSLVGVQAVPLLKDMFSERLARNGFYVYNVGFLLMLAALGLSYRPLGFLGSILQALGAVNFSWQVIAVFRK